MGMQIYIREEIIVADKKDGLCRVADPFLGRIFLMGCVPKKPLRGRKALDAVLVEDALQ